MGIRSTIGQGIEKETEGGEAEEREKGFLLDAGDASDLVSALRLGKAGEGGAAEEGKREGPSGDV